MPAEAPVCTDRSCLEEMVATLRAAILANREAINEVVTELTKVKEHVQNVATTYEQLFEQCQKLLKDVERLEENIEEVYREKNPIPEPKPLPKKNTYLESKKRLAERANRKKAGRRLK